MGRSGGEMDVMVVAAGVAAVVVTLALVGGVIKRAVLGGLVRAMNWMYGPSDPHAESRDPKQRDPHAYKACADKWERLTKHCVATGDRYLVVGNGFVGKRIVDCLLERGERDVVVFDIVENNHWKGDKRVRFVRGDVTNEAQTRAALAGVHTVYSTFAIIKFMERLDHQAALSYRINVEGTDNLLRCCVAEGVPRMVVTSSSHATTDTDSEPRLGRDETADFVSREKSIHHYGWTKALADRKCLEAHGTPLANKQGTLQVTVVRPCSAVFGGTDKLTLERILDMGLFVGIQPHAVSDWVYIDNVVLGHLLAERALRDGKPGVAGEAFCISNDDAMSVQDYFMLVKKHIELLPDKQMRDRVRFAFLWIPQAPMFFLAHLSEGVQRLTKGRVSLGADLDVLTPAMLDSVGMTYSYTSDKARRLLGYEPCWTVDEAIQQSLQDYYEKNWPEDFQRLVGNKDL